MVGTLLLLAAALASPPSVDTVLVTGMTSPQDAAVVVGLEDYAFIPDVPGARRDATAFRDWLVQSRGIPADRVRLLTDGNRELILDAIQKTAPTVGPDGLLWFVFAGHGAVRTADGEPMILGDDVRGEGDIFDKRGVTLADVVATAGPARTLAIVDACNAGLGRDGTSLAPGMRWAIPVRAAPTLSQATLWYGAWGNQFARPLDDAGHGLFTWSVLGALRGWADGEGSGAPDGQVDLGEAIQWVEKVVRQGSDHQQVPHVENPPHSPVVLTRGRMEPPVDASRVLASTAVAGPVAGSASVSFEGADKLWLERDGSRLPAGPIPPGTWTVWATFGAGAPVPAGRVVLHEGEAVHLRCRATFQACAR